MLQVTKHAGSVQKGFALIGGILVTAVVQSTLENSALTLVRPKTGTRREGVKRGKRQTVVRDFVQYLASCRVVLCLHLTRTINRLYWSLSHS